MSVIQNIRDKYARWAVIAIAVSLLGFILMDAFAGRTGLFSGGNGTTIGKIDGTTVDYQEFIRKVDAAEKMQRDQGYDVGENGRQQIVQSLWDQEVNNIVLTKQYDELGLTVTEKELRDILFGANPPQDLRQRFTDPKNNIYNAVQAQQFISQIRKQGTQQDKDQLNQYLESLEKDRMLTKYTSLLTNTIYFPKWFLEKRNVDNSRIAKLSYVSVPYASIMDSTIKVTDSEVQDYINAHKTMFEQKDETRSISYVSFSAAPSKADSQATYNVVSALKAQFDTVTKYETFVARNSNMPYYGGFISKEAIQQPMKDSILNQPVGVVYGPYLDPSQQGAQYVLSKIVAARSIPDTVKVRHILVATQQQTQGGMIPVRDEAVAKKLIDSIAAVHKAGTSFDTLVAKFSDDPGSKEKGGVYENVTSGRMVPTFNDFIFTNPVGTTGVVKTDFGYHYIEILSQKGSSPAYKVAYVGKPIVTSDETENNVQNAANLFAGDSRSEKSFNDNWEKNLRPKGVNKLAANNITPMAFTIEGLNGSSRRFVRSIFEADKGAVVGPEKIGNTYVVAVVTDVNKPGLVSVAQARPSIEPMLRNKKKAQQIISKIGSVSSLEDMATKTGQQIQTIDSVRFAGGGNVLSYEPKVLGAAFNPDNKGKLSQPIPGQIGVYVVRVENIGTVPVESANIEAQRQGMEMQMRQNMMQQMQYGNNPVTEPLKKTVKIKDNRAQFF